MYAVSSLCGPFVVCNVYLKRVLKREREREGEREGGREEGVQRRHTQTDILSLEVSSVLLLQIGQNGGESSRIVSRIEWHNWRGSHQHGRLPPHQSDGCVVGKGGVGEVGFIVEVIMN